MNEEQIDQLISALSELAQGVNKIGDGVQSIATYLWLPIYCAIILFLIGLGICAIVCFG